MLSWYGSASAQIPDKFTNLKILPKTISKDDLIEDMRGYSVGLGVRCGFCHAQVDSTKGKGLNFASDAKDEKKIARTMMTMVSTINTTLVPKSGISAPRKVQCITCHHGVEHPETLADLLKKTVEKDGIPAAQQQYKDLRAKYYGSAAYDFTSGSLQDLAGWLAHDRKDADGAIAIANFSIEQDPKDPENYSLRGMVQAMKGDKPAAIESYKKALELDPQNHRAQELLKALQSGE
jgi:tetratricopeptide (TPR) repeat protein